MKTEIINIHKDIKQFYLFLFLFSFFILSAQDSLKTNYNLNDPRNPNCPCHKYQKLADDEFKKILASANNNQRKLNSEINFSPNSVNQNKINFNQSDFSNLKLSESIGYKHKKYFSLFKHKRKKKIKNYSKIRRAFDVKHWEILKRSRKLNSCFHWK